MRKSHVKGRFDKPMHAFLDRFGSSVGFDKIMWRQDILGSIAHVRMLARQRILSASDAEKIEKGLRDIAARIQAGKFDWSVGLEDVHMNIESRLTDAIGPAGGRLHTARSRNDQVATDFRLWLREALDEGIERINALRASFLEFGARHLEVILPGYTHLQRAQPVRLAHWAHAWEQMLARDADRLFEARRRLNRLPLGSAALAGTPYPIDRRQVARLLGFESPTANSLDGVSDRDFALDFLHAAALCGVHLSRLCEEIVLWTSQEFRFADLDDALCTGSSIMPQKKNPDLAELIRGKSGRLIGHWNSLAVTLKSLPLAYNKDMQEDKEPVFDAAQTLHGCLEGARLLIENLRPNAQRMREACEQGFLTATDLADWLVGRGMPFRDAHAVVGKAVAHAAAKGIALSEVPLETYRKWSRHFDKSLYSSLSIERSVESRKSEGGTSRARVRLALSAAQRALSADLKRWEKLPRCTLSLD